MGIATGGRNKMPSDFPGLEKAPYTTNETLFNLSKLPNRMIVIGSGVVALEMAQAFQTFGSKVTVLVRSESLFPNADPDVGATMRAALEKIGIQFLIKAKVTNVETLREAKTDGEDHPLMNVSINANGKDTALECECLLVATGRAPNIENLNLEKANIKYDLQSGILVDDNARSVSNPNVYSVGDCTACVPRLTHMSGEM